MIKRSQRFRQPVSFPKIISKKNTIVRIQYYLCLLLVGNGNGLDQQQRTIKNMIPVFGGPTTHQVVRTKAKLSSTLTSLKCRMIGIHHQNRMHFILRSLKTITISNQFETKNSMLHHIYIVTIR
jgi:hypothetical protein